MMAESPPQKWFEMEELRRRKFADAVWIPLYAFEEIVIKGTYYSVGYQTELLAVRSIAFPPESRELAEQLGWDRIGAVMHGSYAYEDGRYKTVDAYQHEDGENSGIHLVFSQSFNSDHCTIWHINQDLVVALELLKEEDSWVRPNEGYVEVMRQRRDQSGRILAIEIKREFLKDYLAARGLSLRLFYYRQRKAIVEDASYLEWFDEPLRISKLHDRFQAEVFEVDAHGGPYGGGVAVFEFWRTDVYPEDDVPTFDAESEINTDGRTRTFQRGGPKLYRIEGELWREEWIESAGRSERVRGDDPLDILTYVVDGAGERVPTSALNNEDVGRYLWFDARVLPALINRRGGRLAWYTAETGQVSCSPGYLVHFGVNRFGLVNAYAYDVARLPQWQQRIWHGYNVSPDGGVSEELLAAQMKARPASTVAPETALREAMNVLDMKTKAWLGQPLFKPNDAVEMILNNTHRFRALDKPGLLALAKDIARLTADRIDIVLLRKIAQPPKGENWRSLKLLEKALATVVTEEEARGMLTPLVGAYELRLGDAHLPSEKIAEAYVLAGIDPNAGWLRQGEQLLAASALALRRIGDAIPNGNNQ